MRGATSNEESPCLTFDKLTIYFNSNRNGTHDIFMATRTSTSSAFGAPVAVTELNTTTDNESDPSVAYDHRRMYFARGQPTSVLYQSVR